MEKIELNKPGYGTYAVLKEGKEMCIRDSTYTVTADSNYSAIFLATPIDMEVIGGNKPAPAPQE